jgi:hypothetical protein
MKRTMRSVTMPIQVDVNAAGEVVALHLPRIEDAQRALSVRSMMTIREAARLRRPLDGTDAQALEGAVSQVERELEALQDSAEWMTRDRDTLRAALSEALSALRVIGANRHAPETPAQRAAVDELERVIGVCAKALTP